MQKKCVCGMCQGACDVVVDIEDGRIAKVRADKDSPRGRVCPRGARTAEALYGDQRIMHPMIREGERGEGRLREATWDEALDHAAKLIRNVIDRHGARAFATYFGRGVLGTPVARLAKGAEAFAGALGSPNDTTCSSICNLSANTIVPQVTFGLATRQMLFDIERADLIVCWGKNPASDEGPRTLLKRIKAAKERGAKLVVVDPRQTGIGQLADWWVPVRPGADGALALALLKEVVGTGCYDHGFVRDFTRGFDDLTAYLDTLSLDTLSRQCGISVADIRKLADLIASTTKAPLVFYTGIEYQASALQNARAIWTLWAITGKLDAEGGVFFRMGGVKPFKTFSLDSLPEGADEPFGAREFPLFYRYIGQADFIRFPRAVLEDDPYPVRGLIIVGGSPAITFPDSATWKKAYAKLECLIAVDRFFTEEAKWADVVLPAASLFETPRLVFGTEGARVLDPVVPPAGDARNDVLIMAGIAERLGTGGNLPHDDAALRDWMLAGAQKSYTDMWTSVVPEDATFRTYETGALRADGKPGFPTPSGKFEIASTTLEELGIEPLPKYVDIRNFTGQDEADWPFLLSTGARDDARMGAFGANVPGIAKLDDPHAEICAEDAADLGIREGDLVRLTTAYGSLEAPARIAGLARGTVHLPHGGGSSYMPPAWRDANCNDLASLDACDPDTGFALIKTLPCKVEKVAESERKSDDA